MPYGRYRAGRRAQPVWRRAMTTSRFAGLVCLLSVAASPLPLPLPAQGVEYRGGRWFDGSRFVPRTMYVVDGVFRTRAPARVDSVVDLAGGYVVPPFADAHQHLVDPRIDVVIRTQLTDGVFYLKDQGSAPIL